MEEERLNFTYLFDGACVHVDGLKYLQYPMPHTSTNRKIPDLEDMSGEKQTF